MIGVCPEFSLENLAIVCITSANVIALVMV